MERGWSLVNVIWESPLFYCGRWSDSLNILKKERIKMRRNLNKIRFILCESCFWCASCLNLGVKVDRCPICDIGKVESMQVSDNELYKSNRNPIKSRSTANFVNYDDLTKLEYNGASTSIYQKWPQLDTTAWNRYKWWKQEIDFLVE